MFSVDTTITDLKIREQNLYKAIFSMNFHQIATPDMGNEDARFYLFIFREGGKFLAHIVLFIPGSQRSIFYSYSENPFSESNLPLAEDDARAFAEDMGFFLDEKVFAKLSPDEKDAWFDEQPIFMKEQQGQSVQAAISTPTQETPAPAAQSVPQVPLTDQPAAVELAPTAPVSPPVPQAPLMEPPAAAQTAPPSPVSQPVPQAPIIEQPAVVRYQPAPAAPPQPAAQTPIIEELAAVQYQPAAAPPVQQNPMVQQPIAAPRQPVKTMEAAQPVFPDSTDQKVHVTPVLRTHAAPVQPPVKPDHQQATQPAAISKSPGQPGRQKSQPQQPGPAKGKASNVSVRPARVATTEAGEDMPADGLTRKEQGREISLSEAGCVVHRDMEALARLMASF